MNSDSWLRRPIVKLSLGLLFLLAISTQIYLSHAQPAAARPVRSSPEVLRLRTEVRLLENEVRRLRQTSPRFERTQTGELLPDRIPSPPQIIDGQAIGRSDPMFERLATLVIELKERIVVLEEQLSQVENQLDTLRE